MIKILKKNYNSHEVYLLFQLFKAGTNIFINNQSINISIIYYTKMSKIDAQLEALYNAIEVKEQKGKKCAQQHSLDRICVNDKCLEDANHCSDNNCQSSKKHIHCFSIQTKGIFILLNQNFQLQKQFLVKVFEMENKMFEQLNKARVQIVKKITPNVLKKTYQQLIDKISKGENNTIVKGKLVHTLYEKLLLAKVTNSQKMTDLLKNYDTSVKKNTDDLINLKDKLFCDFYNHIKPKKYQTKEYGCLFEIDSNILYQDFKCQEKFAVIRQALNHPKSIQLLFRGSQNQFSCTKFLQKCGDVQKTFTLIKTEFGNIFGGFNPMKWKESTGSYVNDTSKLSFLLSFDLGKKMTLIKPEHAFASHSSYGPRFGRDFVISDKCNQNANSYTQFPYAYNFNSQYTATQQTYTAFCGSQNNNKFRVEQYQVFKVINQ